jgi:GH15 family glucan-1,4-alpha-glucosidase
LAKAGYLDEAKSALSFMLNADSGEYEQAVGYPYLISITRYYGSGREETDTNSEGPNIEFDNFGLFLWSFAETILQNPTDDWWKPYWPSVRDLVANVLVYLTEEHTFLISPDSSIWERHWNGNEKHFTYSTIMAVKGLCMAAKLADLMGDTVTATKYRDTVGVLLKGIRTFLIDSNNVLAGNLEQLENDDSYLDMAAIEAFNFGVFQPGDPVTTASLQEYQNVFFDGTVDGYGGYYRVQNGDWYDVQEWSFIDLRTSIALGFAGQTTRRDNLLAWVLDQSKENNYLMGELYCRGTDDCDTRGDYKGSIPMIGFGPGAYFLALESRNATGAPTICSEPCTEDPGVFPPTLTEGYEIPGDSTTTDSTPTDSDDSGCSCKTGSKSSNGIKFPLFLLMSLIAIIIFRKQR